MVALSIIAELWRAHYNSLYWRGITMKWAELLNVQNWLYSCFKWCLAQKPILATMKEIKHARPHVLNCVFLLFGHGRAFHVLHCPPLALCRERPHWCFGGTKKLARVMSPKRWTHCTECHLGGALRVSLSQPRKALAVESCTPTQARSARGGACELFFACSRFRVLERGFKTSMPDAWILIQGCSRVSSYFLS